MGGVEEENQVIEFHFVLLWFGSHLGVPFGGGYPPLTQVENIFWGLQMYRQECRLSEEPCQGESVLTNVLKCSAWHGKK